uniref:Uncharacterized protein n=1 Tax=Anopheles dirus TaxID=7168 RepID=A0A182N6F5_9DIPT
MANNVAGQLLVYALLLFFMLVVVFLSYALILHTEQTQMWSTIKDRGATRVMPNGTTNYWYYIIIFVNESKSFTIRATRFICAETPYEVSELLQCKTILRRNKPTFFNFSLHIPMVLHKVYFEVQMYYKLNEYVKFPSDLHLEICSYFRHPSKDIFSRHVLSVMFETTPQLMYYCPHGNTTYNLVFWMEERFFPKSMPAGDFRLDVWFRTTDNKTLFAPFTVRVTKFVCTDTPYELSELLHCKTTLRRNKPTLFNFSVHIPMVLNTIFLELRTFYRFNDFQQFPIDLNTEICSYFRNPSEDVFARHVMSINLETVPHFVHYCPHGLLYCKTVLRRNKPTFFNISVHVPMVLNTVFFEVRTFYKLNYYQKFPIDLHGEICTYFRNPSEDVFSRHVMSIMLETIPHIIHQCPHGNKTYTAVYWLEDKFFPKSMPAGDFRQDVWFRSAVNKTLFAYQVHFSVRRQGIWRPFTVRVTKFLCAEAPYDVSELLHCKTTLRRNKPTLFNFSLYIPRVLNTIYFELRTYYRFTNYQQFPIDLNSEICSYFRNPSEDIFSRHVMSIILETMPQVAHHCPHGNRTYNLVFWLEERFFPKSVPAGDFRIDVWFRTIDNKTIFAYQAYFSVRRQGSFSVRVTKFICTETPYELTNLLLCKTVLRRNQPTMLHITLHVPMVLNEMYIKLNTYYRYSEFRSFPVTLYTEICSYFRNPSDDPLSRQAMSLALETIPQYMHYCPHGNATYIMDFWLEDKFFPKSMPAGDFRMDVWFLAAGNKTLFAYQAFFSVRRRGILKSLIECNESKEFSLRVLRYVCTEAPYERSVINYCRTQLRRNKPTLFNLSVDVPEVLNEVYIHMKTYYRYRTFQIFPIDVVVEVCSFLRNPTKDVISRHVLSVLIELMPEYAHYCPHGNTTYIVLFWLEERFLPKSMPAGDYRLDAWFRTMDNVTLFAYQAFFSIRRKGVVRSMIDW